MKKFILLLFIISLVCSNDTGFFDYTSNHTLVCSNYTNLTHSQLWSILYLHEIDRYSYLIISPGILCLQISILIVFLVYKVLRESPGDLFIGLLISMMVDNFHLMITAIYYTIHSQNGPYPSESFPTFCQINGFLSIMSEVTELLYSIGICLHIVLSLRTNLKYKKIKPLVYHLIIILIAIIFTYICYAFDYVGLSIYGTCSIVIYSYIFPIVYSIASVIFIIVGAFSLRYFQKHMPDNSVLRFRRYQQIHHYSLYIFGVSIISIAIASLTILAIANCNKSKPNPEIDISITIQNLLKLVEFCFLNYVIVNSGMVRKKIKSLYRLLFMKRNAINMNMDENQQMEQQMVVIGIDEYTVMQTLRISQVGTIIFGVQCSQIQSQNLILTQIKQNYFSEHSTTKINSHTLADYNIAIKNCPQMDILETDVTTYAPKVFKQLMRTDGLNQVYNSFQLNSNYENMFNMLQGEGGRSGQFFFFTTDNKYLLKTVNQNQLQILLKQLSMFYEYYKNNPDSLLSKIYGLYTFKGKQIQRTFHVILMKNIIGCDKTNVQRVYDMKGSSHHRQTLMPNIRYNYQQLRTMTLKDIDFKKLQGSINIKKEFAQQLKNTLDLDTKFLKSLNLIDYSFLIIKVKWRQGSQKKFGEFWNRLQRISSITEPEIYYHIGIIDYIQKWDIQKMSEKWWKTLFGAKDVSAQSPLIYQTRFMQLIQSIIPRD